MQASDSELIEAWRGGDLDAGEALFERYYDSMLRFFRNKVSDSVADLVQQTFIACVEGRDRMRSAASFRSYLFAVAHNVLRAHLRSRFPAAQPLDFETVSVRDLSPGPGTLLGKRREQRLLLEALRSIPVEYQVVVELRYWERLKTSEISEIIGVPHPTTRSRLRRAHELLERALAALADSPEELRSTLAGLQDWALSCRALIDGAAAPGKK